MSKVRYNQSGYVGQSMSVNAMIAYESGEKPKSKWTKQNMVAEIREYCEDFDLVYDEGIEKMKKADMFSRFFKWSSWHHTGKYANETDFYWLDEDEVCRTFKEAA